MMSGLLLNLMLIVALATFVAGSANRAPVAGDDPRILLFQPTSIVDIPVLDNDMDADGDPLRVVAVWTSQGGVAEIVDGTTVRVLIDWSRISGCFQECLVAGGAYLVSDGTALRQARWSVWYWPVMQP